MRSFRKGLERYNVAVLPSSLEDSNNRNADVAVGTLYSDSDYGSCCIDCKWDSGCTRAAVGINSGLGRSVREHVCIGLGQVFDCNSLERGSPAVGAKHWD